MTADLQDVRSRFDLWFYELDQVCRIENPWGFLCLSALIDYLSRLANGKNVGRRGYIQFIRDYFPDEYKNFHYKNGATDLPEQMYYVLRNGLVHSFSLIPDVGKGKKVGRDRSIVLIHAESAKRRGLSHLDNYGGQHGQLDAALFVAEDFLNDTKIAAYTLLQKAMTESVLEGHILSWFTRHPPIRGEI
jgi:hypothetical protein